MEPTNETPKETEEKKKNLLQKMKDKVHVDEDEFEMFSNFISIFVRLLIVVWTGGIVTLNYLPKIPGLSSGEKQDITFPASLLASALSSFGLEKSAKKRDDGTFKVEPQKKEKVEGNGGNGGNGNYGGTTDGHVVKFKVPIQFVTPDGVILLDTDKTEEPPKKLNDDGSSSQS